jgi:glutathione S-transferase
MTQIILHNYPQSPVAEKVRVGLGIKGLAWASVEIPRIPPRPLLLPLTGGYRRTPVMQIGADIYCDSQCILREIDRRHPQPTFYPGGADGMAWGVSRWTDGELFTQVIKLVLGGAGDALPRDFAEDRGRLYLGADWAEGLKRANADLPHIAAQIRAQFGWMDQRLATGRRFMLGEAPGLPDALAYYLVWFVRGRWPGGAEFLSEFAALEAWETRVKAIGHGTVSAMSADTALATARSAEPQTAEQTDPHDPQGLTPGMAVTIAPDLDGGEEAVAGHVHAVNRDTVAILREDAQIGRVCVHFPRVGYRINRPPQ